MRRLRALGLLLGAAALVGAAVPVPPGDAIRVRGVTGETLVTLVPTAGGGLARVDLLARLLGGTLDSLADGRWRLGLYGVTLELVEGTPFAAYNGFPLPLAEPTRRIDGAPHASLQLFSEVIPRFGIGILWDRARGELRLFQAIARRAAPTPPPGVPAATAVHAAAVTDLPVAAPSAAAAGGAGAPEPERAPPEHAVPARAAAEPTGSGRAAAPRPSAGLSRRYVVAVDAGHGGVDPGNPGVVIGGRRVNEAKLTLSIALKVEQELAKRGIGVVMTRRTDTLIALHERGPIANARKADLFLSIHTNAANPKWRNGSSVRGFETYFLSEARTEDERRVAAMENDVVRFEASVDAAKGDPLSFIINDLAQNEHLRESSDLAALVQSSLARAHPGPSRGVKQAGFSVLMRAYMPAVLIEVGFGTNPADARWMADEAGQREAAVAIAEATVEYLQHYERRTRASQR